MITLGKIRVIGQVVFGTLIIFFMVSWIATINVSVSDAGLGVNTIKKMDDHKKRKVFYSSLSNALSAAENNKTAKKYYWLGASQLYGINDFKLGDLTAPSIVSDNIYKNNMELFTLSYPNAYPSEHLIIAQHIVANTRVDGLILGAVYDDMREKGIRIEIARALQNENTRIELKKSPYGTSLVSLSDVVLGSKKLKNGVKKITTNLMERSERIIIDFIEWHFNAESIRQEGRGQVTLFIIKIRQFVEGLRARYTRDIYNYKYPIPEDRYADNWKAWTGILKLTQRKKIPVLIYIAPRPVDFFPYEKLKYETFKSSLQKISEVYNASFINLEDLVKSDLFGMVDTNFGFLVRDPFHFQGKGHVLLAGEVMKALKGLGGIEFDAK